MLNRKICIKFCVALFLTLLLCELALRAFFFLSHKNILAWTSPDLLLYERHPFLEYTLRPNVEINCGKIKLHINSLGFRGKEFDPDDARPFRVFVLGGSSVFNRSGNDNIGFCAILEKKLQAKYPDRDIEIVNAGVSGYTTFHSLINLSTRILDYNPDAIIVYHSWNDIKAWPYLNRKASYGQSWQRIYSQFETHNALATLANHSYLWLAMKPLRRHLREFFPEELEMASVVEKTLRPNEGGDTDYGKLVYKRNIRNIVTVAKKNGVQVLLINPLTLVHSRNSSEEKRRIAYRLVKVPAERLPQLMSDAGKILEEVALEERVPYIDLNKRIGQNLVNLFNQIHLTPQGNEAIAEYLSQHWDEIWPHE
ncbi:MAG: GDSL-type esterase/lipase family protein [Candidatus Omnitrophica bacterium]|nr:GDSL-type esterase/lipase family protein [Candidatus Omnitrophota bacterium]